MKKIGDVVYTIKEKDTNEYHIFEGKVTAISPILACDTQKATHSICEKLKNSESIKRYSSCSDENEARQDCLVLARKVCGNCVSHLYLTLK